ncbi:MAG: three-Cys-motif partner protein TcmP [Planctomycetaceae bacterium]|nr:three-Cys-motif partner protein TcmP [Planctomycetaceae bacterium]
MGKDNDRQHFEDYRRQTQAKHDILEAYLPSYFHILKRWEKNLLFIDGFAGRGTYTKADTGEKVDGSPLRALRLIAENNDLAATVSAIFIESDPVLYAQLEKVVNNFYKTHQHIREPSCLHGTFADCVGEVIETVKGTLAPTFLFVDPCGVSGASFGTIRAVMKFDKCEAFIFFNIDGVRRIAGLDEISSVLVDLMGSKTRAEALYRDFRKTTNVGKREELILTHYEKALKSDIGADYVVKFRVEHEDKQKTSHYLIHATKHPLGFKIMKDVMWRRGHSDDRKGALELAQASRTNFVPLFDFRGDVLKGSIVSELAAGRQPIERFYDELVCQPDNEQCESSYKAAILELEAEGAIQVLGKDGKTPTPAELRQKRKGKATLGRGFFLRLSKRTKHK